MFFGRRGCADILCTPLQRTKTDDRRSLGAGVSVLWIECKSPTGGTQRPAQKEFQKEVEAAGHFYIIANSSDDVLRWLQERR